jgi:hypothetical protein
MKNLIYLLSYILFLSTTWAQGELNSSPPISVFFSSPFSVEQNIIGLQTVSLNVVNLQEKSLMIKAPDYFSLKVESWEGKVYRISEKGFINSNGPGYVQLEPFDTLTVEINVNFFDFAEQYYYNRSDVNTAKLDINFWWEIYARGFSKPYVTEKRKAVLNPLELADVEAFNFLKSIEENPYYFTAKAMLHSSSSNTHTRNLLVQNYPQSTFATLASLSLAYQLAREAKTKPELKDQVNQLLAGL